MVYLNLSDDVRLDSGQLSGRMRNLGILVDAEDARRFRLVTHYWIDDRGVERTVKAFGEALR